MSQSNSSFIKTKSPKRNEQSEQAVQRKAKANKPLRNNDKRNLWETV